MYRLKLTPSSLAVPQEWRGGELMEMLKGAALEWSYPKVVCANLSVEIAEPVALRFATEDNVNLIAIRVDKWCHNEQCGRTSSFPWSAMGMTTSYAQAPSRGGLGESDIEVNARYIHFTDMPVVKKNEGESAGYEASLHALLVHEIGHVLGFRDTCAAHGKACEADFFEPTVMHAAAQIPSLTQFDQQALCAKFPREDDVGRGLRRPEEALLDEGSSGEFKHRTTQGAEAFLLGLFLGALLVSACLYAFFKKPSGD